MKPIIWGTAGHIDHGKTALIEALTGTNTDRLSEEQDRGVTIDIGFAFLSDAISFIDVPGHEKFVKNMVTGVSTIDAVLLVVAADDGIMPQTEEHLQILQLLGVEVGCVAITKSDLARPDWMALVEESVSEFVAGTFLEDAPVVKTSAIRQAGIGDLADQIYSISETIPKRADRGFPRLPVDRSFSIKGFGTVVTGSVLSGEFKVGQVVQIFPAGLRSKIRGIQSHGHPVEQAGIAERAALNLTNIDVEEIRRGDQLSAPEMLHTGTDLYAKVKVLPNWEGSLVQNQRIRIHLGTTEILARISILRHDKIPPGESDYARLRLEEQAAAVYNDKFIIRFYSPMDTMGGGTVLYCGELTHFDKKTLLEILRYLDSPELQSGIQGILCAKAPALCTVSDISKALFFPEEKIRTGLSQLAEGGTVERIEIDNGSSYMLAGVLQRYEAKLLDLVSDHHDTQPTDPGIPRSELLQSIGVDPDVFDTLVTRLADRDVLAAEGHLIREVDHSILLTDEQNAALQQVERSIKQAGLNPPDPDEIAGETELPLDTIQTCLKILRYQKAVERLPHDLYLHKEARADLQNTIRTHFAEEDTLSVSQCKALTGGTRKYVIPILEYMDQQGWTIRDGEIRKPKNILQE